MTTVLITAIGGDIAQAAALIVRETFPHWRILGCELHERHGGGLFADRVFLAPPAAAPQYGSWIETLCRDEGVDACIPMSDAELRHFVARGGLDIGGATLVMPNARAIDVGADKLATARHLAAAGCPAPWTVAADEPGANLVFPCIFKPRRSAGSKGVTVCLTADEAHYWAARQPDAVFQELLLPDDQEVTCAIYRTRDGRTATVQLLRKLVGGFTGWAQVIGDDAARAQCERLAESLDLCGSINAQLRLTADGPRIFEINARFSSTVLMRHRLGFQDLVWALREAQGEPVDLRNPPIGAVVVRTHGAAVLSSPRPLLG